MSNLGVQINNPYPDKIVVVRTDNEPKENHHPILDDPRYAHLLPWTVTIKTKDKAIRTITVQFNVFEHYGIQREYAKIYTEHPAHPEPVISAHSSCAFWPGGRMPNVPRHPMMSVENEIDAIEHAKLVVFSIDYIEFEDGSTLGPNLHNTPANLAYAEEMRRRKR